MTTLFYRTLRDSSENVLAEFKKLFDLWETLLTDDYLGGKEPGHADIMLWPWLERLQAAESLKPLGALDYMRVFYCAHTNKKQTISKTKPRLWAYVERMRHHPRIAPIIRPDELHARFIASFVAGNPDYDAKL